MKHSGLRLHQDLHRCSYSFYFQEFLEQRKEVVKEQKADLKAAKEAKLLRTVA